MTPLLFWLRNPLDTKMGRLGWAASSFTPSSAIMNFYLQVFHSFQGQSLLFRCYKASVLDAIPSCVMRPLCAKQGGGFLSFCLIPMHELSLGPDPPVCLSSISFSYSVPICITLHIYYTVLITVAL